MYRNFQRVNITPELELTLFVVITFPKRVIYSYLFEDWSYFNPRFGPEAKILTPFSGVKIIL